MNERIRELAEQVGITFKPMTIDGVEYEYRHVHINDTITGDEASAVEMLAKLLVRECIDTLERHHPYTKDPEAYLYSISIIEEHFGVENAKTCKR
jgi:hypothetical protein